MSDAAFIEADGIHKHYGGVHALDGATLQLRAGEVHALVGANGAGKSTLKNVLSGIVTPDAGSLRIDGQPIALRRPADALAHGIRAVHQEIGLIPSMSVEDNVHLGQFPTRAAGLIRRRAMRGVAREALRNLGIELDPRRTVGALSVAQQQLVEIARAVVSRPRALLLDEPSAVLVGPELERLFAVVERMRADGIAVLYVSHRLDEIFRLADRVTIMRNGRTVRTAPTSELDHDALISGMTGRPGGRPPTELGAVQDEVRLRVEHLSAGGGRLSDVLLEVRRGEIVGLAGLMGSGRSHLLKAIFGIDRRSGGRVVVDGAELAPGRPRAAIAAGVALVPEDRKDAGLVLGLSIERNLTLANLERVSRGVAVDRAAERTLAGELAAMVGIAPERLSHAVFQLSGGNQQKVAVARWLAREPGVLLVDEPTRGVDVEAKAEIHRLIAKLAADGAAVLVVSSEFEELLALCHRVIGMRDGGLTTSAATEDIDTEELLRMCSPPRTEVTVA
jgi:rhamnose transport system ATP-binding protein